MNLLLTVAQTAVTRENSFNVALSIQSLEQDDYVVIMKQYPD
jgi:hypothetical protein